MSVKLHCCSMTWARAGAHPCWRVQKALNEQGIEYELVKGPLRDRGAIQTLSGQSKYPVIEFDDGRIYREESKDMAARIRAGRLFEGSEQSSPSA